MNGKMMVVTVRCPNLASRQHETLEADADEALLDLVNAATRKRINEQKKQNLTRWIEDLQEREAAVLRRERIVSQKEAKQRALSRTVNLVLDGLLVLFSTIGMVVTVKFIFGLWG